jgi:cytochrome c2
MSGVAWLLILALLTAGTANAQQRLSMAGLEQADYMAGKLAFQGRCSACHTLAESSSNIAGPNLWGVFERQAGSLPDFTYSDTLREADFQWSPDRLDAWLTDPKNYLPGNIMGIPEPVPAADRANILHFMLIETGAVDWARPAAAFADAQQDRSKPPSERFPSFWNHLMYNTANYRWVNRAAGEELQFQAYFKPDGSIVTSRKAMTGFWHITDKDFFCYALLNMPVSVGHMVECFPVAAMAIPRFAPELWVSRPQKGVELHGGMLPGRPDWVLVTGQQESAAGAKADPVAGESR